MAPPPVVGLFCRFPVTETSDHLLRFNAYKVAAFVAGVELIAKSYSYVIPMHVSFNAATLAVEKATLVAYAVTYGFTF